MRGDKDVSRNGARDDQTSFRARLFRIFGMKSVLAANVAFLVIAGWGFSGEFFRNRDLQKEVDRLMFRADALETKNAEIADTRSKLSSADMVEREARLKLGLQKPGEEVVVVRGEAAPASDPEERVVTRREEKTHLGKWIDYFFH